MEMPEPAVLERNLWNDLQPLLERELNRLPEKYRTVIVLCELEDKSVKETARQLGCPDGTVASRLARARTMLAKRLARHSLAITGGTLGTLLSQKAAAAAVPGAVASSTVKAVCSVAAGQAATISETVAALTEGVIKTMFFHKLLKLMAVLLVVATLISAAGLIYQTQATEPPKASERPKTHGLVQPAGKERLKTDTEAIQGTWLAVSAEADGRPASDEAIKGFTVVITADKIMFGHRQASYKLEPTKMPKVIDMTPLDGPKQGQVMKNIYRLDGDHLSLCLLNGDGDAPTQFSTKAGDGLRLLNLKRQTKEAADEEQPQNALNKLQGTWRLISSEIDGVRLGEGRPEINDTLLAIDKSFVTMTGKLFHSPSLKKEPEDVKAVGKITLDTTKNPNQIVFTWEKNPWLTEQYLIQRGIFVLDGDSLKLCFYKPGEDTKLLVPTEFSANYGSKRAVSTFKRVPN